MSIEKKRRVARVLMLTLTCLTLLGGLLGLLSLPKSAEPRAALEDMEDDENLIKITFTGDWNLMRQVNESIRTLYKDDMGRLFDDMNTASLKAGADLLLGNMECAARGSEPLTLAKKNPRVLFACDKQLITELLDGVGFDAVTVANNHANDNGPHGFDLLLGAVNDAKHTKAFGFFNSRNDAEKGNVFENSQWLILDAKNVRVAFVGVCTRDTCFHPESQSGIMSVVDSSATVDCSALSRKMERLKVDTLIPFFHWGHEYQFEASSEMQGIAAELGRCLNVQLIAGSHSHSFIPPTSSKQRKGRALVLWSLGNALFDSGYYNAVTGVRCAVRVTLRKATSEIYGKTLVHAVRVQFMAGFVDRRTSLTVWSGLWSNTPCSQFA